MQKLGKRKAEGVAPEADYGFRCFCGEVHCWDGYALAHWNEELRKGCHICGRRYSVLAGKAILILPPCTDRARLYLARHKKAAEAKAKREAQKTERGVRRIPKRRGVCNWKK
jgi:hypothetical protein